MKLNSPSQHSFAVVPEANIQRSSFKAKYGHKGTCMSGYLIPYSVLEIIPGDTMTFNATIFARLVTQIVPVMDNAYLTTFHFFIPNRLVHSDFRKMMGEQANPGDSIAFAPPQVSMGATGCVAHSLYDYLGVPIKVPNLLVNNYLGRGYNLCWNEFFRDQNLQNSLTVDLGAGPDTVTNYTLQKRCKRFDYFTSCLPGTQRGIAVSIGLTGNAPVTGIAARNASVDYSDYSGYTLLDAKGEVTTQKDRWSPFTYMCTKGTNVGAASVSNLPSIYADLSAVTGVTINSLRLAVQTQKFQEREMRGGSRFAEIIKAHYNVTMPDAKYRPEFLGSTTAPIMIAPIAQTSQTGLTGGSTPLGNLAAMATVTNRNDGWTKSFTEWGFVLSMFCITCDLTYQQGVPRHMLYRSRFDYYFPEFSHIGEQPVFNAELYAVDPTGAGDAQNKAAFGYQEYGAHLRYHPSQISGQLRSTHSGGGDTTLDYWHWAQKFASLPVLNSTFITENPPIQRSSAVLAPYPEFVFDSLMEVTMVRPMPLYSDPGYIDHF